MVTRNFLNILAMALQAGSATGSLPIRTVTGEVRYAGGPGTNSFPGASLTTAVTLNKDAAGISVGTGSTPAKDSDYNLEAPITAGINLALAKTGDGIDEDGCPYVKYDITVTNTGSDPITVTEIGYKQNYGVTSKYPGSATESTAYVVLLDRSVLSTRVTIAAGDAGIITYKLRTIPQAEKTIGGVKIVSFSYGTDEEIAAMLDAAGAGDIDLQRDAGWQVGDARKISLAAFTGGNNVSNAAEDLYIAISSFEEYQGCGNVMQFDFLNSTTAQFRMNSSNTTTGGYGATEMKTVTLPAMAEALPAWLKSRLKTFSVLASAGGSSLTTIETVAGNKLALRSEAEVFGSTTNSNPGEGTQAELYRAPAVRFKTKGVSGLTVYWWERSASSASYFCNVNNFGGASQYYAGNAYGVAPFGCV